MAMKKTIIEVCDFAIGTSIGDKLWPIDFYMIISLFRYCEILIMVAAVILSALMTGKSTLDVLELLFRCRKEIFNTWTRPHDHVKLEGFLKAEMGPDVRMFSIQRPRYVFNLEI